VVTLLCIDIEQTVSISKLLAVLSRKRADDEVHFHKTKSLLNVKSDKLPGLLVNKKILYNNSIVDEKTKR